MILFLNVVCWGEMNCMQNVGVLQRQELVVELIKGKPALSFHAPHTTNILKDGLHHSGKHMEYIEWSKTLDTQLFKGCPFKAYG